METLEAKASNRGKLIVETGFPLNGVLVFAEGPKGNKLGHHRQMTLKWDEWDRLVAWVAYQRSEQEIEDARLGL